MTLLSGLVERNEKEAQAAKNAYRASGMVYIISGIALGVLAAVCNVLMGQLKHVPVELPAFKYLSIPLWLMAAVMVLCRDPAAEESGLKPFRHHD